MERKIYALILFFATINISDAESIPKNEKTINKCCPFGKYVGRFRKCQSSNITYSFSKLKVYDESFYELNATFDGAFTLIPGKFEETSFIDESVDVSMLKINLYVMQNGDLNLERPNSYNRWIPISNANYCIDYRVMKDPAKTGIRYWVILPGEAFPESNMFLTYATLVSCFFMLLVLIVYILLPELQNLCGMILMAYVASLFLAFLLLAIIQIQQHTPEACIGLTMGIYYFFLASFCWMSVMSFDIWWTFRGYAKARPIHRRGEHFKFLMYCLYAWGVPLAMTTGLAILNKVDMKHLPWVITPHVPDEGCFLEGGIKFLYLYIPMLILIFCNWVFYLMTAFNVWRLSRGTAVLDSAAAGNKQAHRTHRNRFMVYLKLSIVMGLNWVLEIISFVWPGFRMWYITDTYNILIGFAIFLIFVCKRKIFRMLCKRYGCHKTLSWYPSSKSYSSSVSDSNQDSATLQLKVHTNPRGRNGSTASSIKNRLD
ncbi:unnamed protein product [Chrysodeixis includens]|uniref:G-protein coupled receptors family 2 profile 2 domain-containing protein n=1 Tax=Chrysodeixis includens TaxID=689277 RepID=A0A9N8L2N4_CHRIL|nr:unnamed protein product [Chrysodeixis includens]